MKKSAMQKKIKNISEMIFLSSIRIHGKLAINSSFVENWSYVDQIIMSCDDEVHNACIYMVLIELEEIKYAGHGIDLLFNIYSIQLQMDSRLWYNVYSPSIYKLKGSCDSHYLTNKFGYFKPRLLRILDMFFTETWSGGICW